TSPVFHGAKEERAAFRELKKQEHMKEQQRQLDWLVRDTEVDWDQMRALVGIEGLHPNYTDHDRNSTLM
ncbi:unnamed protein product, partial [Polarella glacialis]